MAIAIPRKGAFDDPTLRHLSSAVAAVEGEILPGAAEPVAEHRIAPAKLARQRLRIRIEQQLVVIKSVTCGGIVWPVDAIAIKLIGPHVRQIAMPDLVGVFGQHDASLLVLARALEQAQFDLFGMRREQCEVDPLAVPRRPKRVGKPRPDPASWHKPIPTPRR